MNFLDNAFKSLQRLNEETFDLGAAETPAELQDFLDDSEDIDSVAIIDDEAETEDEIQDSYIGKVILDCNVCHSLLYKDPEEVEIEGEDANVEEECPYCYSQSGYKVIGQVKPFGEDEEEESEEEDSDDEESSEEPEDDESEEEPEEEEKKVEESFRSRRRPKRIMESRRGCRVRQRMPGRKPVDEFLDFGCVNAQGQTIGLGFGGGTGISNGGDSAPSIPGMGEELQEEQEKNERCTMPRRQRRPVEKAVECKEGIQEKLKEDFKNIDIETEDSKLSMSSDDSGKITITQEPVNSADEFAADDFGSDDFSIDADVTSDETIGELDADVKQEIENNEGESEGESEEEPAEGETPEEGSEEEVVSDEDIDFDEESFDELGESYLKNTYENVTSYKTSKVSCGGSKLVVEGVITFKSGSKKKTTFVFESKRSSNGKTLYEGYNKEITRSSKTYKLTCDTSDSKKIVSEKLNYRYRANKKLVEGCVRK